MVWYVNRNKNNIHSLTIIDWYLGLMIQYNVQRTFLTIDEPFLHLLEELPTTTKSLILRLCHPAVEE